MQLCSGVYQTFQAFETLEGLYGKYYKPAGCFFNWFSTASESNLCREKTIRCQVYVPFSLTKTRTTTGISSIIVLLMIITTDLLFDQNLPGFENLEGLKVKENQS
ncbi:MAG: hypothetical protein KDE26_00825 [Bacteroidetes bacterium]|nr:hypothetical protein [Bacteroidota bacterium]MCB0841792.1 hypothetical protein [Bacteroidota bacterium]